MRILLSILILPLVLFGKGDAHPAHDEAAPLYQERIKSPEEIQVELDADEKEFRIAKEIFNPWYTGPLITPGASMVPVGKGFVQPYLFVIDNYAAYNSNRKSVSLTSKKIELQAPAIIQAGITDSFDITVGFGGFANWQAGEFGGGWGDMTVEPGFSINKETPWTPEAKVVITQNFPTGKYQNLSFNGLGLNATGSGAWSTSVGFIIAKVILWKTKHPMNMRLFMGYQRSPDVDVQNFNAYGGGRGTRGTVSPGDKFSVDFGYEYSFNQKWVFATDIVYTTTKSTTFRGTRGVADDGTPAVVGGPSSDNLSLSPALEYNFNSNIGLIAGAWFSVYGRNSLNFAGGVISATILFP